MDTHQMDGYKHPWIVIIDPLMDGPHWHTYNKPKRCIIIHTQAEKKRGKKLGFVPGANSPQLAITKYNLNARRYN